MGYIRTFDAGEKMHESEACDVYRLLVGGVPVHWTADEVKRRLRLWLEANDAIQL